MKEIPMYHFADVAGQPWFNDPLAIVKDIPGHQLEKRGFVRAEVYCDVYAAGKRIGRFSGPLRLQAAMDLAILRGNGAADRPTTICAADRDGRPLPAKASSNSFQPCTFLQ